MSDLDADMRRTLRAALPALTLYLARPTHAERKLGNVVRCPGCREVWAAEVTVCGLCGEGTVRDSARVRSLRVLGKEA